MFNPFRVAPKREEEPKTGGVVEVRAAYKDPVHDWDEETRKWKLAYYKRLAAQGQRHTYEVKGSNTAANIAWLKSEGFEVDTKWMLVRWLP